MSEPLTSEVVEVDSVSAAMDLAWEEGWTDGLPIVPPTADRVARFLEAGGREPGDIIGAYKVRNREINAEKVAINAVMAGCKPEFMPIVNAAIEAVTDEEFHMNHIASTSSPWPAFVVNGPIAEEVGLNAGLYVLGPGRRANATIGRAVSLTLANCMDAKVGGVQQGAMGSPFRLGGMVIAEKEDDVWEPLSVMRGFKRGESVVTAFSTMEGPQDVRIYGMPHVDTAEGLTSVLAEYMSEGFFSPGPHLVLFSPSWHRLYLEDGWSKQDVIQYLEDHTRSSVARLRRKGRLGLYKAHEDNLHEEESSDIDRLMEPAENGVPIIEPHEEEEFMYHARSEHRRTDYSVAVAGGEVGAFAMIFKPYPTGPNTVSKAVRKAG